MVKLTKCSYICWVMSAESTGVDKVQRRRLGVHLGMYTIGRRRQKGNTVCIGRSRGRDSQGLAS